MWARVHIAVLDGAVGLGFDLTSSDVFRASLLAASFMSSSREIGIRPKLFSIT